MGGCASHQAGLHLMRTGAAGVLVGFAGGLAREGFEPLIHTSAVFIYRRPLDQLQMSVA